MFQTNDNIINTIIPSLFELKLNRNIQTKQGSAFPLEKCGER